MTKDQPMGEYLADAVVSALGSWRFIIIQTVIVATWIILNVWLLSHPFDPMPLILLNLIFSTQASYASPLILMSQNRQAQQDRQRAEQDLQTNLKSEAEIRHVMKHLNDQDAKLTLILDVLQTRPSRQAKRSKGSEIVEERL